MVEPTPLLETPAREGPVPFLAHPGWQERFPWLAQGTTTRGEEPEPFDLALFGDAPGRRVQERWSRLREATGCARAVHGRQVHRSRVMVHASGRPGLLVVPDCDGHATRAPGVLLTVALADCVPVFLVDPERRTVALLHAGWRGAAAGILERGLAVLEERLGAGPAGLHLHLGPAICGRCYEVGPEVHRALGLETPGKPTPVDLRGVLAERAAGAGIPAGAITISEWCTLCGGGGEAGTLFSHRGAGTAGRQVAFLGVREGGSGRSPSVAPNDGGEEEGAASFHG